MKCIVCGQEIPAGEAYCPACGSPAPAGGLSYAGYMHPADPAGQAGTTQQNPVQQPVYGQAAAPVMPQQNQAQPPFMPQQNQGQSPFMPQQNQAQPPFMPQQNQGQSPFMPQQGQAQPPVMQSQAMAGSQQSVPAQPQAVRYVPPSQASFMPASEYDPYSRVSAEKNDSRPSEKESEKKTREQKKKTGMIIGIIAGVLVVGAAAVCWMLGLFHFKNGTYIWEDYSRYGTTIELELKGDKGVLTASYSGKTDTQEVDVSFDGSTVTFTANGKRIDGTYDRRAETISVADESLLGFEIVMKKK